MRSSEPYIFDGHNDLLSKLRREGRAEGFVRGRDGHVDLPRARRGGFGGGLFAIWLPSPQDLADIDAAMESPPYDLPLPEPLPQDRAMTEAARQAALLLELDRLGALRLCRTVAEIRAARAEDRIAAVMHLEGAEPIGVDLDALDLLHAAGLRSLGLVWSRPNAFGHGVPFRFPSDPDTGPGLTRAGRALVRRCAERRILVDVSHLNASGFDDVAGLLDGPFVASHSNAHALTPQSRNLTDRQLDVIRDRDGLVGVNFAVAFLRPDGRKAAGTPHELILDHAERLMERLGETRVGLGSDYDGAEVPEAVADVGRLGALREAMRQRGYDEGLIARLCHGNWLDVLERAWGA
jgi:membrane dipeptidase